MDWSVMIPLIIMLAISLVISKKLEARENTENKEVVLQRKFSIVNFFKGRLGRLNFLIGSLIVATFFLFVAGLVIDFDIVKPIITVFGHEISLTLPVVIIFFFISQSGLYVRRLHDMNLSGWLVLMIPVVMLLIPTDYNFMIFGLFALIPGTKDENKFGKKIAKRPYLRMLLNT